MTLEDLLAERDIYRQLIRFARAMDNRDWAAMDSLTATHITADVGVGELSGRAAFIQCMRSFLDECGPTQHLLGNVLIDVQGEFANSQAYVSDMHLGTGDASALSFRTLGEYSDQWQRINGSWLMIKRVKHNRGHIGSFDVFGRGAEQL